MKVKVVYKRYVTLLEVIIATALTVLILTTLTFFYSDVTRIGIEIDQSKQQEFYLRYAENRLATVLPNTIAPSSKDFAFFSTHNDGLTKEGSETLIFTFNNGISLEKEFSNQVVGRLYLDKEGNFNFAYWPLPKNWDKSDLPPIKKEVLLLGIDSLKFEFFVAPEKSQSKKGEESKDSKSKSADKVEKGPGDKAPATSPGVFGEWYKQLWQQDFKDLPVMVKLVLGLSKDHKENELPPGFVSDVDGNKSITLIFPLLESKAHIIYN